MSYDPNNIFARILRGEIPCNKLYEDDFVLAFHDIQPKAQTHVLVIPKGPYENQDAFSSLASEAEIIGLTKALGKVAAMAGLAERGYRIISNCGANGGQEVPHYHIHLLGGEPLGRMVCKKD